MQQAFSTFGLGERVSAGKEGVNVLRMALLRAGRMVLVRALLAHHFYVHLYLRLHDKPRFDWEDDFNFIVYVIHTTNFDIP